MATYEHPELRNLAATLDEGELQDIAQECLRDYQDDEDSRSGWLEDHALAQRLYYQKDIPVNPPWEGSSTESMPMLAESCNQFYSRGSQAMFPSQNIIRAVPIGKSDKKAVDRGTRVGRHMSWQLLRQDKSYKRNKKRLLLSLPLHGSFLTKVYYHPVYRRNVTKNIRATDFVVPFGNGPRDVEDLDRKAEIIHMTVERGKHLENKGYFIDAPLSYNGGKTNQVDEAEREAQGLAESTNGDGSPCRLIEVHRLLDIDDDGLAEPYIITIDLESEKVLRISVRWDTDERGNPTNDREPIEYYTHYAFIENPNGFYGLGYWHLIGQLNKAVNKLLRQNIDSGTLRNVLALSGFMNKGTDVKKGELQMQLGKFVTTSSYVEDFSKAIWQPRTGPADPTLIRLMETIMMKSDRLSSVTEAITGQTEAVMQPTTLLNLIDQSLQQFSSSFEGVVESWTNELEKHFRLNGKFLDPEVYFTLQDEQHQAKEFSVARNDYKDDLQVTPVADPKLASEKQKLARAEATWQHAVTNPLIVNSPPHLREAARRYLEAVGEENINGILPQVQSQMPRVDDPHQENIGALSPVPQIPMAHPGQDHMAHIEVHSGLMDDPEYGARLQPEGIAALEDHINAHIALMYGQTESGNDPAGMGEASPDAALPPGAEGSLPTGEPMDDGGLAGILESLEGASPDT